MTVRASGATRRTVLAAGIGAPFAVVSRSAAAPIARTAAGAVRGRRVDGVLVFKGVRYGAAPVRFARSRPPTAWRGVADAFEYGPSCPQRGEAGRQSEDCLFLNVWTPGLERGARRPVMVYIHGGAYNNGSGSSPLYDGTRLATRGDVVVVTVNHRLNAFGYLSLPLLMNGAPDSGNVGQWDLVLALEWVRANAAAFGGDPGKVMVFGQSGGGAKIASLMAAPAAKGLFHSAATMSGQQVTASGPLNAKARARAFVRAAGVDPDAADALLKLRSAPAARLVEALDTPDAIDPSKGATYFGPVVDGAHLARHPFWPDAPSQSQSIPMLLGNTRDETRNLIGRAEPDTFTLTWEEAPHRLAKHMRTDILPDAVIAAYRAAYPELSPSDVFFAATTAGRSWRGQVEEADARARASAPTWVYRFDLPSPNDNGKWGAPHTIDIPHVFGTLDAPGSITGLGDVARRVSDQLQGAFLSLARSGDPNHGGLPAWGEYRLPSRATMVFGETAAVQQDPRRMERELFAQAPFVQWGT